MLAGVVVVGYLPHTTAVLWSPARRRSLLLPRHASASRQISGLCSSLSRLLYDAYLPGIADRGWQTCACTGGNFGA